MKLADTFIDPQEGALLAWDAIHEWLDRYRLEADSETEQVVYEGIILGTLALVAGALITTPILVWFHNAPPDLSALTSGFSFGGSQWRPILRVEYSWQGPIASAVALFLTSIFAAMYPAWKATRVPPADALADR